MEEVAGLDGLEPNARVVVNFFNNVLKGNIDAVWELLDEFMKNFVTEAAQQHKGGPIEPKMAIRGYFAWDAFRDSGEMSGTGAGSAKLKGFRVASWDGSICKIHSVWGENELVWVDKIVAKDGMINEHQGAADRSGFVKVKSYTGWKGLVPEENTADKAGIETEKAAKTAAEEAFAKGEPAPGGARPELFAHLKEQAEQTAREEAFAKGEPAPGGARPELFAHLKEQTEQEKKDEAALKIQALQRGKAGRETADEKKKSVEETEKKDEAALKIQALQRGKVGRETADEKKKSVEDKQNGQKGVPDNTKQDETVVAQKPTMQTEADAPSGSKCCVVS